MKGIVLVVGLLVLSACATTNPRNAAGIYYRLPRTDAKITLGLDVTDCVPDLKITPTLKIDSVAGAQDELWHIAGTDLASNTTKRGITIDVDDNGVISAVNATATDQQTTILGNIVKIAATVAPFAAKGAITPVLQCSAITKQNVVLKATLQARIEAAQGKLPTDPDPAATQKQINALAAQLAAVKAALHGEVIGPLKLEPGLRRDTATPTGGSVVVFDFAPFKLLFDTAYIGAGAPASKRGVNDDTSDSFRVIGHYVDAALAADGLGGTKPGEPGACKLWMTLPGAKVVKVVLEPVGPLVKGVIEPPDKDVSQTMPASQLGGKAELCLSAGFGENRTVGLKFDKFGRTTEFAWTADARAANVTSALAGAAPDAATVASTLQGHDLAADKKELDHLTTEQSLKKARACQAILDAGGSTCP